MFWTMKVWDLFISSVFYFLEDLFGKLKWQSLFLWSRTQKLFGMIWKVVKKTKISEKNWEYTISSGPPLTLDWRAQTVPAKTDQKKRIEVHTHTHTTHSITHTLHTLERKRDPLVMQTWVRAHCFCIGMQSQLGKSLSAQSATDFQRSFARPTTVWDNACTNYTMHCWVITDHTFFE